jgi:FKBP-type peptidyl-prolyl cis-trans isomerase
MAAATLCFGLAIPYAQGEEAVSSNAKTPSEKAAPKVAKKAAPKASAKTVTTASGLKYQVLKVGKGPVAKAGQTVSVHYTGWLTNGKKFDSSVDRNQPFEFNLGAGQVIRGWDEGVAGMKVGEKRKLTIPSDLGYGSAGAGGVIPPNATLVFDVELLGVK